MIGTWTYVHTNPYSSFVILARSLLIPFFFPPCPHLAVTFPGGGGGWGVSASVSNVDFKLETERKFELKCVFFSSFFYSNGPTRS